MIALKIYYLRPQTAWSDSARTLSRQSSARASAATRVGKPVPGAGSEHVSDTVGGFISWPKAPSPLAK
jgi:hypothetical protein